MTIELRVGQSRFPDEEDGAWTIDVTPVNAKGGKAKAVGPAAMLRVRDGQLLGIQPRGVARVPNELAELIKKQQAALVARATKQPMNFYQIYMATAWTIWFETRFHRRSWRGRIVGYKCIANPVVRARAGLRFSKGSRNLAPQFFILEDPEKDMILVMNNPETAEAWEKAALESIGMAKEKSIGISDWADLVEIDDRDEYVLGKMRTMMRRVVQSKPCG